MRRPHPGVADERASEAPSREEFGRWYEAYRARLYRYVRWRVAGREAAEDIVATVFMRAFRRLGTYRRDLGAPITWLLQIARNAVNDHLRRLKRTRGMHVSVEGIHDLVCEGPSPEERLLYEERVRRLLNTVANLKPRDREVLELRYGGQLQHSEIAEVLGITESAAAMRVHRALRRLEDKLTEEKLEEGGV